MLKGLIGLSVFASFAMAGCLTTQYQEADEAAAQKAATRMDAPLTPRRHATAASYQHLRCPAGTKPHAGSGTCLLVDSAQAPATTLAALSAVPTASNNLVRASTLTASVQGKQITRKFGGVNYRVETGDTVYSLARRLCVPVAAIQIVNGLDANYSIAAGQGLSLPRSQC